MFDIGFPEGDISGDDKEEKAAQRPFQVARITLMHVRAERD